VEQMIDINTAIDIIIEYEGLSLTAYKCPSGVWTIGYGHTAGVKEGDTISKNKALDLLLEDIEKIRKQLDNAICKKGLNFSECQYNALLSFTYNCGIGNFNKLVKDRTNEEIGKAILLYNKSNGIALRGLTKRRQTEHDLYFSEHVKFASLSLDNIGFKVRDNYRIRTAPTKSASVIAFTDSRIKPFYKIKSITGDFVLTDKGYIHKDAFYCSFEV
jgi:lysozyme